jgi:hypothetical protein
LLLKRCDDLNDVGEDSPRTTWTPACLFANLKVAVAVDDLPATTGAASSVAVMVTTEGLFSPSLPVVQSTWSRPAMICGPSGSHHCQRGPISGYHHHRRHIIDAVC